MFHGEIDSRDAINFVQEDQVVSWKPSLTLRPHHLMLYMPGGSKWLRLHSPIKLALETVLAMAYIGENTDYELDATGQYGTPEFGQIKQAVESIKQELRDLPDDALVRLDLFKDRVCNSCAIGKHCLATNFRLHGLKRNYPKTEEKLIKSLRKKLLKKGFVEDVDFKLVPETQEFLDYQGQSLWRSRRPPIPTSFDYNAMMVRMGALREVVYV